MQTTLTPDMRELEKAVAQEMRGVGGGECAVL